VKPLAILFQEAARDGFENEECSIKAGLCEKKDLAPHRGSNLLLII